MPRSIFLRSVLGVAFLLASSAVSSALLMRSWQVQSDNSAWLDDCALALTRHVPMGRAAPSTGPWPYPVPHAAPLFLAETLEEFMYGPIENSRAYVLPDGTVQRTYGFSPPVEFDPDHVIVLGVLFLVAHIATVVLIGLLFRVAAFPHWARPWRVLLRALPSAAIVSAALAAPIPGAVQLVWSLWLRVPRHVMQIHGHRDPITNHLVLSPDHIYGVATGPAGRGFVGAGMVLVYGLTVGWCVARRLRACMGQDDGARRICGNCAFPLEAGSARCPECGRRTDKPFGSVTLGKGLYGMMASPWRWGLWLALGGTLFTFLAGPLVLGWIGRILPESIWLHYIPY